MYLCVFHNLYQQEDIVHLQHTFEMNNYLEFKVSRIILLAMQKEDRGTFCLQSAHDRPEDQYAFDLFLEEEKV